MNLILIIIKIQVHFCLSRRSLCILG